MAVVCVVVPLGCILFMWWCTSRGLVSASLGDITQRGLVKGCGVMDSCRVEELSSDMAVLKAGLARAMWDPCPEDGSVVHGGDNF
jgi:hypothetical protein